MRIFNLTDKSPPWIKDVRQPRNWKHKGIIVPPGESREFKDESLASIAGWIRQHVISVDSKPAWYLALSSQRPVEVSSDEDDEESLEEESEE